MATKTKTKKVVKKAVAKKPATKKKVVKKTAVKKAVRRKTPTKKENEMIVIPSPVASDIQVSVASELADDSMIEAELAGEVLPFYIYSFTDKNKEVTGLTVKGVNEVVRRLNRNSGSGAKIRINPDKIIINRDVTYGKETGVEVIVFAENLVDGNSAFGAKFEAYEKIGRKGKYPNTFALEKALSKAERNAKRKLIPEVAATKMIEKMMNKEPETVQYLDAPPPQYQARRPKVTEASSIEDIQNVIREGIKTAKNVEVIMTIDEQTANSDKFSDDFKKEVHKLASSRVDELTSQ